MSRSRNARGEGERLRHELLDATEDLLAEHGDERAVSIRAITRRVGVTPPSLYLHFDDKEALVTAVVARCFTALADSITEATRELTANGDAAGALRAGALAYLRWARENPGGYVVLFRSQRDSQLARPDGTTGSQAFDNLVGRVEQCQRTGVGRQGDAHTMATVIWSALHGIATLSNLRDRFPWPAEEQLVDELLGGVVGIPRADR
jgi:AcrR family transcriptional regulator